MSVLFLLKLFVICSSAVKCTKSVCIEDTYTYIVVCPQKLNLKNHENVLATYQR